MPKKDKTAQDDTRGWRSNKMAETWEKKQRRRGPSEEEATGHRQPCTRTKSKGDPISEESGSGSEREGSAGNRDSRARRRIQGESPDPWRKVKRGR